jgi:heme-degrading monooxygenase HmoA
MTAVVVFRARVRPGVDEAYAAAGARMEELVRQQPGFLDVFGSVDDESGVESTIVLFEDEASVRAWRDHPEHQEVRRRGHEEFYDWFEIIVASSARQYEWTRPKENPPAL